MSEHICGLSGYDPMQDPPCPACEVRVADYQKLLSSLKPATPEKRQAHPHAEYALQVLDTVDSLQNAIREAGGAITITPGYMRATTLETLILMLASNGVRFHFDKSKV